MLSLNWSVDYTLEICLVLKTSNLNFSYLFRMETKRVKQLYLDSERIVNKKIDEKNVTYDMEKVKEYFVNYTRVVLLANEITNGDQIGKELDKELAELTQEMGSLFLVLIFSAKFNSQGSNFFSP